MSSNLMVLPPETLLQSQYRIVRVLGKPGGFGITYLAWDTLLETQVAIKEYFPRDYVGRGPDRATVLPYSADDADAFGYGREQFLQEARTLAKFDHAHVVRVFNFFEANGTAYFVMAYYEGYSLSEYVRQQGGKLPAEHAVQLMLPVLDGLREVHGKGFLHRDVKPQNIYLAANGRPILLDFGAARLAMSARSRSLSVVLTPGFAPYEQYMSRGKQGPWTDTYAAAATLYFLITGQPPLDAADRIMDDDLKPLEKAARGVPSHIAEAVMQGLALQPEDRQQTIRAFQDQLLGLPAPPPEPPPPTPPQQPVPPTQQPPPQVSPARERTVRRSKPAKPVRKKGWRWGLLGVLLLGGSLAAFVFLLPPEAFDVHREAGQEAHARGDFASAIQAFQQALAHRPGDAETAALLADATERYRNEHLAAFAVEREIQLPITPEATAVTPDGSLLAVGGPLSGQIWLYTLPEGERLAILPRPSDTETQSPRAMVFAPDGRSLYAANSDGTLRKETPLTLSRDLRTHWASRSVQRITDSYTRHPLHALALYPDGSMLAIAAGFDETWGERIIGSLNLFHNRIFFWNTQTRDVQPGLIRPEPEAAVYSLAFAAEGRLLIYGTADGNIHFLENPHLAALSQAHAPAAFQPASWRPRTATPPEAPPQVAPEAVIPDRIQAHRSDAHLVLSPDERWLATFGNSDTLKVWELTSRRLRQTFVAAGDAAVTAAAFTTGQGDGELVFAGDASGRLHLWSRRLGVTLDTYPAHQGRLSHIHVLSRANIVTVGSDNRVKIWDTTARSQ